MADAPVGPASNSAASNQAADLDAVLLAVIACPVCHGSLAPTGEELVCAGCARRYPVRDGVPVLLADDAVTTDAQGDQQ